VTDVQRTLNLVARPRSPAASAYRRWLGLPAETGPSADVIAPGVAPRRRFDLVDHGGKTIPKLAYVSFFLGGSTQWTSSDVDSIDSTLAGAMSDGPLNEIMGQYFGGKPPLTSPQPSTVLAVQPPPRTDKTAVEGIVAQLQSDGRLLGLDLSATVANLMLPPGTILTDTGGAQERVGLDQEAADSLHGLGGYHGSVHFGGGVVYYSVGVYSQRLRDGQENGIVAFEQPWKNVVATFYHELNEARTDADVEDAVRAGNHPKADSLLGWTSSQGFEVGDFPIFEVKGDLALVFKEVQLARGGTAPIQLMWSNRVHGPEQPG
jgi:hypothetical protein